MRVKYILSFDKKVGVGGILMVRDCRKFLSGMIQHKTICKVIDNSGALLVECINVLGTRGRIAKTGDEIVCVCLSRLPFRLRAPAFECRL